MIITQRNCLLADLSAAEVTRERAVTGETHEDQDRAWQRWSTYLDSIGIVNNEFLDGFTRQQQNLFVGAFAMALHEGQFSGRAHGPLALGTITNTI